MRQLLSLLPLCLLACDGGGDTGGASTPPPEVAGAYNVIISGTTGCDGDETWVTGWAEGPLVITGTDGVLSFDFGDPMIFSGGVSASGQYSFSGSATYNEAALEVSNVGSFSLADNTMSGEFEVVVDDDEFSTNNCTVTAPMTAAFLGTLD
jgi:hypothetical protein